MIVVVWIILKIGKCIIKIFLFFFKIVIFFEIKEMLIILLKCFILNKVNNVKEFIKNKVFGYISFV